MADAPPSDRARLELFVALARDYHDLTAAFPVEQRSFKIGGPSRDPSDRWHRLVRAFALRKFFLGDDHVGLRKVFISILAVEPGAVADVELLREATYRLVNGGAVFGEPGGENVRAEDIIRDTLYGGYLHGDYDKWLRSERRRGLVDEMSLFTWTHGAEVQLHQVVDLAKAVLSSMAAAADSSALSARATPDPEPNKPD